MDSIWLLFIILAVVLVIVAILATTIGYFWASSATKSALLKQLEDKSDATYKNAQEQLQAWKERELSTVQKQVYDVAKGQAIQEMQEQVKNWKDNELKQIRQQIHAGLYGDAIKEAQEQLVKWRNDDLESAKHQMWDMLSKQATADLEQWKTEAEKEFREQAADKRRPGTTGRLTEHMAPYLPGFGFNPADVRFIGSPVDLVIFDGLDNGDVRKIVFVEIMTGPSKLSAKERIVKEAVINKKVEWVEVKTNVDGPEPEIVDKVKGRKNSTSLLFSEIDIDPALPPPSPNVK
jgi:predicted Holliday junction resolvase-like endonuclease